MPRFIVTSKQLGWFDSGSRAQPNKALFYRGSHAAGHESEIGFPSMRRRLGFVISPLGVTCFSFARRNWPSPLHSSLRLLLRSFSWSRLWSRQERVLPLGYF